VSLVYCNVLNITIFIENYQAGHVSPCRAIAL